MNNTILKIFVIEPNFSAKSEVWLHRMNAMLHDHICGMAAYIQNEIAVEKYPVFNLNGRGPNYFEKWLIRFRIKRFDSQKIMRTELQNAIVKSKADVLIVHYATLADYLWDVLSKFTIPIYIYVHGFDIIWDHCDNQGNKIHSDEYKDKIVSISKNQHVKFIAGSNCSIQNLLSIGIEKAKIEKKIFGVDLPTISRDYNKKELTILFLGRFVDYKGPDIVLNAFILACERGFKGKLIMAGDGPLRMMCELIGKRSKFADRIQFTGEVNAKEANALFMKADIYSMHNCEGLLSKGYDTFAVSIIEAMSFGLPIVTAGVGGPSELIVSGVDGILVETNNVISHADAFLRLFQNEILRSTLGNNARMKISNKYNSVSEKKELFEILNINFYQQV